MTINVGDMTTSLEARVAMLEQRSASVNAPSISVQSDPTTGAVSTHDPLVWASGWDSYSKMTGFIVDESDPGFPAGALTTGYGPARAYMIANTCFLTGLVRRTGSSLVADTRYTNLIMFVLPTGWRPEHYVPLHCLMGPTAADGSLDTVGHAWIEVRPEPTISAGRVLYVTASAAMTSGSSWIALQGSFPCVVTDSSAAPTPPP